LCDDIFAEGRAAQIAGFCQQAALADCIATTGAVLRDVIAREVAQATIEIVPDHAESLPLTKELLAEFPVQRSRRRHRASALFAALLRKFDGADRSLAPDRKTVVWFGMSGSPRQDVGLATLHGLAAVLNDINHSIPLQLLIVSGGDAYARVREFAKSLQ